MRLLVVEDDNEIRSLLKMGLESEGFAVDTASEGATGSYLARTNDYDLIVLDIVLPKKSGIEICSDIRASGKPVPIIVLTVQSSIEEKLQMFECGADDYLTKPFSFYELLARIRALLRRPLSIEPDVLEIDDLRLDTKTHKVTRGGQEVYLTRKEYSLLEYLMRNRGIVVSRGMIMEHVWNIEGDLFSNTIEAHILNVRKKIDKQNCSKLIRTIPGRGYTIDTPRITSPEQVS